jgi:hypothetical protein
MLFVLKSDDEFPLGGRLRFFVDFWRRLTSNPKVISMIIGARIPFISEPVQDLIPAPCVFNAEETSEVRKMVSELLATGVIVPVVPDPSQFVSQLFLVTNKDMSKRAILNVKCLNKRFLSKRHFKMETLQAILPLIRRFDWFASWDLRKGYYNIALHPDVQRFFCFDFEGKRYQFKCLVMGLSIAPLFFSKLMSVLVSVARSWGIRVSVYLDDSLTRGPSFAETLRDHECFGNLLQLAGFLLHPVKSVKIPVQRIEHLGFVIDSRSMEVEVPSEKEERIRRSVKTALKDLFGRKKITVRKMAHVIGLLVSVLQASKYGRLHYCSLERAKIQALGGSRDFNRKTRWPRSCVDDLKWWKNSTVGWKCSFLSPNPSVTLITDASLQGWGAIWDGEEFFGPWESEEEERIDELELLAVLFAIQIWPIHEQNNVTVQLWCDNQVAVAYIRNMGGRVERLDRIARQIWLELESRNSFILASYVNTHDNPADALTRGVTNKKQLLDLEVQLNPEVFRSVVSRGPFFPLVDWFASHDNHQLPRYFSWQADPSAEGVDAFSFCWGNEPGFIFPPFTLIPRILRKVNEDRASVILLHPDWPGALWAPDLHRMIVHQEFLPQSADLLWYPHQPGLRHPMKDLKLVASWLVGASMM